MNLNRWNYSKAVEYPDSDESIALVVTISVLVLFVIQWVQVNIPEETSRATFFAIFAVLSIFVSIIEYKFETDLPFFNASYFGKMTDASEPLQTAPVALIVGAMLSFIILTVTPTFSVTVLDKTQEFSFLLPTSVIPTDYLSVLYVNFLSPTMEEFAFRGFLFFAIIDILGLVLVNILGLPLKDTWVLVTLSIFITSAFFGLYHFYAYNGDISAIQTAVAVSIMWIVGMLIFKSIAFPLGFHLVNNAINTGVPPALLMAIGISAVVIFFVSRFILAPIMRAVKVGL